MGTNFAATNEKIRMYLFDSLLDFLLCLIRSVNLVSEDECIQDLSINFWQMLILDDARMTNYEIYFAVYCSSRDSAFAYLIFSPRTQIYSKSRKLFTCRDTFDRW
jgi:hypothetical protein